MPQLSGLAMTSFIAFRLLFVVAAVAAAPTIAAAAAGGESVDNITPLMYPGPPFGFGCCAGPPLPKANSPIVEGDLIRRLHLDGNTLSQPSVSESSPIIDAGVT